MAKKGKTDKALKKAQQAAIRAEKALTKKVSIRIYITAALVAAVISLAIAFHAKWTPIAKDVVDKVVDIVTVDKEPDTE
jgi:hypothetical protein